MHSQLLQIIIELPYNVNALIHPTQLNTNSTQLNITKWDGFYSLSALGIVFEIKRFPNTFYRTFVNRNAKAPIMCEIQ